MSYRNILFFFIAILLLGSSCSGCLVMEGRYRYLAPGPWRAVLQLDPSYVTPNEKGQPLPEKVNLKFKEVTKGELPFVFEVIYDTEDQFHIEIINGEERIRVDDIQVGRAKGDTRDTFRINFPVFDSYIRGLYEEKVMEGEWVVLNRENYTIPFIARQGKNHRFTTLKKTPKIDLNGKWAAMFEIETDDPYPAIGDFVQEGNRLTGTFLTETGDYRYLEGTVQDNKMYLSVFDGAHAFLFEALINDDSTLTGTFRSGTHYQTVWEARRDPDFKLKSAYDLTYLKPGFDKLEFSFENTAGKTVSLSDESYKGKIKIVQLFGTWCPNCRDETNFLVDYLQKHPHPDLEVIALAFERHKDKSKAMKALRTYKEKFGMNYELLLAGPNDKEEAAKSLPMLNQIISYPTLIFVDKNDQVRKIHTGFSGPATDQYQDFIKEFETTLRELLAE
ncbi:MAG: TlpA disulfide reductase family protein [Bacteroidota bacterium]